MNILVKIILIGFGGVLLLGGGMCVFATAGSALPDLFRGEVTIPLLFMIVAALAAAGGLGLIFVARMIKPSQSAQNTGGDKPDSPDSN